MKWRRGRRSRDIEDRRGSPGGFGMGRGGFGIPTGGKLGIPALIALAVMIFLGGNILGDDDGGGGGGVGPDITDIFQNLDPPAGPTGEEPDADARLVDFMSFVLDDVQRTWTDLFENSGRDYERARLVLFTQSTGSGCGGATADIGPHYCPADSRVYLDLDFFRELRRRFGAPGDFAQAYVLAHEIGHHVQNVLGINEAVRRRQANPDDPNELSIRLELQADCFAGVWAHTTYERDLLERGDLQEGLDAAAAVGDDRIQTQATGTTNPETWTHGSSEQRMTWFRTGFESGDPATCDTFTTSI